MTAPHLHLIETAPAWARGLVHGGKRDGEPCPLCGTTDEYRCGAEMNAGHWIGVTLPAGPPPRPRLCADCYEAEVPERVREAITALDALCWEMAGLEPTGQAVLAAAAHKLVELAAGSELVPATTGGTS